MKFFQVCAIPCAFFFCFLNYHEASGQEYNMSNAVITDCSGTLYDSGGALSSYANNESLELLIQTGGTLTLTFQGTFSLENPGDTLYVYNGTNTSAPLLGAYTGNSAPGALTVFSGSAFIVFHSDGNIPSSGFAMTWSSQIPIPVPPSLTVNNVPACNASQFNIQLSSPIDCDWLTDADISITAAGIDIPVSDLLSNCAAGQTAILTVQLAQPLSYNCTYSITMNLSIPNSCGQLYPFTLGTSFVFSNCGVNASLISDQTVICPGACTNLEAVVLGCNTYQYSWSNGLPPTPGPHQVCLDATTTFLLAITEIETGNSSVETITIEVENAEITTPSQTVCQSGPALNLTAAVQGQWSGVGIVTGTNQFDPDAAGGGLHWIYFNTAQCQDSVAITVTPIETQEITAACPGSPTFPLLATPAGGTWAGPNTTPAGIFNPSTAGEFEVSYSLNGCVDQMIVKVDSIDGPFDFPPICQSIDEYTLIANPPGGLWSGSGVVDEGNGTLVPALASPGTITLTYSINGCEADFSMLVKQIQVAESIELCPDGGPEFLDPNALPVGGVWFSPQGAFQNVTTGLYNPAFFTTNQETFATYTAPNGCIDSVVVDILVTDVAEEALYFCNNSPSIALNEGITGTLAPTGGTWSGIGVFGSASSGFQFNPASASLGQHWLVYSANGCSDSIMVTVFPSVLPDTPLTFCSTDNPVELAPGLPDGGYWSGTGVLDPSLGIFSPTQATPGTSYIS
ncbi:MAG: CUB domain-containing protein, partial [Flavobacteriales bacterium]